MTVLAVEVPGIDELLALWAEHPSIQCELGRPQRRGFRMVTRTVRLVDLVGSWPMRGETETLTGSTLGPLEWCSRWRVLLGGEPRTDWQHHDIAELAGRPPDRLELTIQLRGEPA